MAGPGKLEGDQFDYSNTLRRFSLTDPRTISD